MSSTTKRNETSITFMADPSISDPRPGESQPFSLLPMLSTFLRVIRKTTNIDDLDAALPALEEKVPQTNPQSPIPSGGFCSIFPMQQQKKPTSNAPRICPEIP